MHQKLFEGIKLEFEKFENLLMYAGNPSVETIDNYFDFVTSAFI